MRGVRSRWAWQNQQLTELAVSTTTRDFALLAPATLCLLEEGGELVLCDTAVEVKNGGPHTTLRELERISDLHALLTTARDEHFSRLFWNQQTRLDFASILRQKVRELRFEVSGDEVLFTLDISLPPSVSTAALVVEDLAGECVVLQKWMRAASASLTFSASIWRTVFSSVFKVSLMLVARKEGEFHPPLTELMECGWYSLIDVGLPFLRRNDVDGDRMGALSTVQMNTLSTMAEEDIKGLFPKSQSALNPKVDVQIIPRGKSFIMVMKSMSSESLLAMHIYILQRMTCNMKDTDQGWFVDVLSHEEELNVLLKELRQHHTSQNSVADMIRQRIAELEHLLSVNAKLSTILM